MSRTQRVDDEVIIKLNDLGLGLKTIANITGYHFTTVKLRLDQLGIKTADIRRSFMEDIYHELTVDQREWLSQELQLGQSIKAFIRILIVQAYRNRKQT